MLNERELKFEEAIELIQRYVNHFYHSGKFYTLKHSYDVEDLVQELCVKWLKNGYLDKYNPEITSKAYFIMTGVKHFFIDTLKKQRLAISLDEEMNEEGLTLMSLLESRENVEKDSCSQIRLEELLELLPDETNSRIIITTEIGGKATLRNIARHLAEGYTQAELLRHMINPSNGKQITSGRLSQYVKEIRIIYLDCGVGV